jgi:SAM-dependent methyltransferase
MTTETLGMQDRAAVKERQRQTWASGDFSQIATASLLVGERLCEAVDLRSGQRVLDVATGSGNTALAAARRYAQVVAMDWVPALLLRGQERAAAERLMIDFQAGDAERLPAADASFDVVLSTFGVMFAPDHQQAARELLRVCRPGGKIGLAAWTPEGWIGELFRTTAHHVPPAPGLASPMRWGTEPGVHDLLGDGAASVEVRRRTFVFRYPSPAHWLDLYRAYYGPTLRAFEALDEAGRTALANDLLDVVSWFNRSGDETLVVPAEYLQVVVTRR